MPKFFCACCLGFFEIIGLCFCSEPPKGAPISISEWHQCEHYITHEAAVLFSQGVTYIEPRLGLPCAIEKNPTTGAIFIHCPDRTEAFIGRGAFKRVSKSVIFGARPELVACCRGSGPSLKREAEILSALRGATGIAQIRSFIHKPEGEDELILKYYNIGSLERLKLKTLTLRTKELPTIFRDLIVGLKNLHDAGYIHRDIHRRNTLLERSGGVLHAVLTDFGLSMKMNEEPDFPVCLQTSTCSPEVLVQKYCQIDRRRSETYSLGVLLYYLLNNRLPMWCKGINQKKIATYSIEEKVQLYRSICKGYRKALSRVNEKQGVEKSLTRLTFQMLNPNPNKRLTLHRALTRMGWREKYLYTQIR